MSKFRIGRHINVLTTNDLLTSPSYAEKIGCEVMQIFLGNPQDVMSKARSKSDLATFGAELKLHKQKVIIHGHYTVNFCHGSDSSRFRTSVKSLVSDLKSSSIIGTDSIGVIIHMGKNKTDLTESMALANYVFGLQTVLLQTSDLDVPIILETGAGVGKEVGTKIDKLASIYHQLNKSEQNRIKFCIDTCHIWAAGYDISNKKSVRKFFVNFDKLIGIEKIACFHLNNSIGALGSKTDRHADLLYGLINPVGLEYVTKFAFKHKIPIIMETPLIAVDPITNSDITFTDEFKIVKNWIYAKS